MYRRVIGLAALATGLCLAVNVGPAQQTKAPALTNEQFVLLAGSAGMFEVKSSELAKDKASSDAVKKFAGHMIEDHTKANKELLELAKKKKWGTPAGMSKMQEGQMTELSGVKGAAFDRLYARIQEKAHEEAVSLFEMESKNSAADADLKAFAEKTLPTLREHLKHAKELVKEVAGKDKDR